MEKAELVPLPIQEAVKVVETLITNATAYYRILLEIHKAETSNRTFGST